MATGRIEEWVKWEAAVEAAPDEAVLRAGCFQPITKMRHTHIYRLSGGRVIAWEEDSGEDSGAKNSCQFEYSAIDLEGSGRWWTVSFEAVGDDRNRVLGIVAKYVIGRYDLLLTGQRSYGYPQFIRTAQDLTCGT